MRMANQFISLPIATDYPCKRYQQTVINLADIKRFDRRGNNLTNITVSQGNETGNCTLVALCDPLKIVELLNLEHKWRFKYIHIADDIKQNIENYSEDNIMVPVLIDGEHKQFPLSKCVEIKNEHDETYYELKDNCLILEEK